MKFYKYFLFVFLIYLPNHRSDKSFLENALKNPTQSQNGGGNQMYDRPQQAAEHIFLPFPHKLSFFEHQNPYAIFPNAQDMLKNKKKQNEKDEKDHNIYQKSIDSELKSTMNLVNQNIKHSKVNEIYDEDKTFQFKLNPHITAESENDSYMKDIISNSEKTSQENENAKSNTKLLKYAGEEYNATISKFKNNNKIKVGDQLSVYNISGLNLSQEFLNQNLMDVNTNIEGDSSDSFSENDGDELKKMEKILENRTKIIKNNENGYNGLQSLFPENKIYSENSNQTYYNGWIHPFEIPFFDKLYLEGYYEDVLKKNENSYNS